MPNLLEQAEAVVTDEDGMLRRTDVEADTAIEGALGIAERRREVTTSRLERMRLYAETTDCRRRLLLGYFGEQHPHQRGRCDNCDARNASRLRRRYRPLVHRARGGGRAAARPGAARPTAWPTR